MKAISFFFLAILLIFPSCNLKQQRDSKDNGNESGKTSYRLVEQWRTDTLLKVSESVLVDDGNDVLYVSCMTDNEEPVGAGYIARVDMDGKILDQEWITGLTSPTGMALVDGKLFVAERNSVAEIDLATESVTQRFTIDSAMFLNDLTADAEGNLYVSDSRANVIYRIGKGGIVPVLTSGNPGPNGLLAEDGRLLMTSMGNHQFLEMDLNTGELSVLADSIDHGDGIAYAGFPGQYLVSSWVGEVFMVYPDHSKTPLLYTEDKNIQTADIAYDIDHRKLYVPTFSGNNVVSYKLISE